MRAALTSDLAIREAYQADVSGLRMVPEAVARPASEAEAVDVLREAQAAGTAVTAAGAQSSTTAASITDRGILLSMRAYHGIVDVDPIARTARVRAGTLVADVKQAVAPLGLTWAPDPTSEHESTVGGAIACNASGARTYRYGPTRAHVGALRVALADGRVVEFHRPTIEKNAAGYGLAQDPVDWFIGSEGTLAVVLEAELRLMPRPTEVVGLALPFADEALALRFIGAAREARDVAPRCLEYFDGAALDIARSCEQVDLPAPAGSTLVYTEQACVTPSALDAWLALAEGHGAAAGDVAVFEGESAIAHARAMRHAVPAALNERGASLRGTGGRRVSTDWAVPFGRLEEAIAAARAIAARFGVPPAVTYGHAGNGHPHQNYLARDAREVATMERVVEETLRTVIAMGGTIAAEHGIGKLKRRWLPLQMSSLQIAVMRAVKRELDPTGLLAPGNIF